VATDCRRLGCARRGRPAAIVNGSAARERARDQRPGVRIGVRRRLRGARPCTARNSRPRSAETSASRPGGGCNGGSVRRRGDRIRLRRRRSSQAAATTADASDEEPSVDSVSPALSLRATNARPRSCTSLLLAHAKRPRAGRCRSRRDAAARCWTPYGQRRTVTRDLLWLRDERLGRGADSPHRAESERLVGVLVARTRAPLAGFRTKLLAGPAPVPMSITSGPRERTASGPPTHPATYDRLVAPNNTYDPRNVLHLNQIIAPDPTHQPPAP
jgi:hypothetical protein